MKRTAEWLTLLRETAEDARVSAVPGRAGHPTLRFNGVFLHSQYRPQEEAERFIESAQIDDARPVLVIGLGLGYHVLALLRREVSVVVIEPNPTIVLHACQGPLAGIEVPIVCGETLPDDRAFDQFLSRVPQVLVHPPSAQAHGALVEELAQAARTRMLTHRRLSIAVVGPMFGGSQPIAMYLERAFRAMGHRSLFVDTSVAWPVYDNMLKTVRGIEPQKQLGDLLVNWLGQWCYARVAEFRADICIVLAQAPVGRDFPVRLGKEGVVTAYWFVENWRHMPYWREIASFYDTFFHIQPGDFDAALDAVGCGHHPFVQTACDPELHCPIVLSEEERALYAADVSFAGAAYFNRAQLFQGLTDYDFALWGVDWDVRELRAHVRRPNERFTHETFRKIVAGSKINVNLHSSTTHPGVNPECDAINPRVYEIAACGGFQLCDPCMGLAHQFDLESELPTYRTLAELREKIAFYLEHADERKAIAARCRERVLKEHTYVHRAEAMLEQLITRHGSQIVTKGVLTQYSMAEMVERVGADTALGQYLASLPPDLPFTQDVINDQITTARTKLTHPEAVFAFLREMRQSAERLLSAQP